MSGSLGGIVSAGIDALGSLGSSVVDNIVNWNIARENLQYQKDYNNQIFEREDSAHQREMADLKAAGLNPLLTVGSAGASAGGTASAVTNTFRSNAREAWDTMTNKTAILKDKQKEWELQDAQIDKLVAERENVEADTATKNWYNANAGVRETIQDLDIKLKNNQISLDEYEAEKRRLNNELLKHDNALITASDETSSTYGKNAEENTINEVETIKTPFFVKSTTTNRKLHDINSKGTREWLQEDSKGETIKNTSKNIFHSFLSEYGNGPNMWAIYSKMSGLAKDVRNGVISYDEALAKSKKGIFGSEKNGEEYFNFVYNRWNDSIKHK